MCHVPRGFVADGQFPLQLFGRDAFLGGADHVDGQEPLGQGQVGSVKHGPSSDGVLIPAIDALVEMAWFAGLSFGAELEHPLALTADAR